MRYAKEKGQSDPPWKLIFIAFFNINSFILPTPLRQLRVLIMQLVDISGGLNRYIV